MRDRIFLDTNVLVYAFTDSDLEKQETAKNLLRDSNNRYVISTQVLNEFYATLNRNKTEHDIIADAISEISTLCNVQSVSLLTVKRALEVKKKYGFSYWDSLILSASIESSCRMLYSEDMKDGQAIEGVLTITNPFLGGNYK